MKIHAIQGDITEAKVDAIVNAANPVLRGGGGVDGAIHRAAGIGLMVECMNKYPHGCPVGMARITDGHRLPAKYVIHTVGPDMREYDSSIGGHLLSLCYKSSVRLASVHDITSIAFPAISTGVYGFDLEDAAAIAVVAIREYALAGLMDVYLYAFTEHDHAIIQKTINVYTDRGFVVVN